MIRHLIPNDEFYHSQKDILLSILGPLLRKRYKEKFEQLSLDDDWIKHCTVSLPVDKEVKFLDKTFNTSVKLTATDKHPILTGSVSVAYQRASFEEYFGELDKITINIEEIESLNRDDYISYWETKLKEVFGTYVETYGKLFLNHDFKRDIIVNNKHMFIFVPTIEMIKRQYITNYSEWLKDTVDIELEFTVDIPYSYSIVPTRKDIRFNIVRR